MTELIEAACTFGLTTRIADAEQFARRNRVVLLQHEETGINVDIALGVLPFEQEAIQRAIIYRIADVELRLPTPEDGCAVSQRRLNSRKYGKDCSVAGKTYQERD